MAMAMGMTMPPRVLVQQRAVGKKKSEPLSVCKQAMKVCARTPAAVVARYPPGSFILVGWRCQGRMEDARAEWVKATAADEGTAEAGGGKEKEKRGERGETETERRRDGGTERRESRIRGVEASRIRGRRD